MQKVDTNKSSYSSLMPPGATSVAFTEFWERFSFYGLQAILFYYLIFSIGEGGLELTPATAASITGAYGGMIYLSQILGAWLGDRIISPKKLVLFGGIVILIGHICLAVIPGLPGVLTGLAMLVLGTGALKTNVTALFGFVVDKHGSISRDASFQYYYVGISLGVAFGPLATGYLQNALGFHWGFGAAAIGMALALVIYVTCMKVIPERGNMVPNPLDARGKISATIVALGTVLLLGICVVLELLTIDNLAAVTSVIAISAAILYFVRLLGTKVTTKNEKKQIKGYLWIFIAGCIYYTVGYQVFTSVATLIAEEVKLDIGSWSFPIAWITGFAGFIPIIAGPLLAFFWKNRGNLQPTTAGNFSIGLLIQGGTHLILVLFAVLTDSWAIPLIGVLIFMGLNFCGELFITPVALSLVTKIGPEATRAQLIALSFLTLAIGSALSGPLGALYTVLDHTTYFSIIAAVGIIPAAIFYVMRNRIQMMLN